MQQPNATPFITDQALTGAESVALVAQPTTAALVGASVSTIVVTVLLSVGVGMGFRWYDKKQKASAPDQ